MTPSEVLMLAFALISLGWTVIIVALPAPGNYSHAGPNTAETDDRRNAG